MTFGPVYANEIKPRLTWLEISYTQRKGIACSFAGIFKMAVRFYNKLNNLSTADFYTKATKKAVKSYEAERVIAQRIRERKFNCNIY